MKYDEILGCLQVLVDRAQTPIERKVLSAARDLIRTQQDEIDETRQVLRSMWRKDES